MSITCDAREFTRNTELFESGGNIVDMTLHVIESESFFFFIYLINISGFFAVSFSLFPNAVI